MKSISVVNILSSIVRRLTYLPAAIPKTFSNSCYDFSLTCSSQRSLSCSCALSKAFIVNNNNEFMEKVMNSSVPVIVNFHAEWCDPCKILSPKLKELVGPMENVDLAIVDVEKNVELVHTFEVKAVPAVLAVRNGLVVDKFIGLVDADMIENLVNKLSGNTTNGNKDGSTENK